jgi:hypothetical protein
MDCLGCAVGFEWHWSLSQHLNTVQQCGRCRGRPVKRC